MSHFKMKIKAEKEGRERKMILKIKLSEMISPHRSINVNI